MSTSNYSNLLVEIQRRMGDRTDLVSWFPSYVEMAETRIYQELRAMPMETLVTSTTGTSQYLSLGFMASFLSIKNLVIPNQSGITQQFRDPQWIKDTYMDGVIPPGVPSSYGIEANSIIWGPTPSADNAMTVVYYKKLEGLSLTNETNWLTELHGNLILYGALASGLEDTRDNPDLLKLYIDKFETELQRVGDFYKEQAISGGFTSGVVL